MAFVDTVVVFSFKDCGDWVDPCKSIDSLSTKLACPVYKNTQFQCVCVYACVE